MLKLITIASLVVLVHDEHQLSDWIGESKLRDPQVHELCCGLEDCKALPLNGVIETSKGYYVAEMKETVPSFRIIWSGMIINDGCARPGIWKPAIRNPLPDRPAPKFVREFQ